MKKLVSIFLVTLLYLLPLSAFAQKRPAAADKKTGTFNGSVTYDWIYTQDEDHPNEDKGSKAHATAKFHAQYQVSKRVTVWKHDGFISIVDPQPAAVSGTFSYTQSSETHHIASDDQHSDTTEDSAFSGTFSENGSAEMDFPDSGENVGSGSIGATGKGSGYHKYVARIGNHPPDIDNGCSTSAMPGPMSFEFPSSTPDSTRPPESGCAVTGVQVGQSVSVPQRAAEELAHLGGLGGGAAFTGSFASGKFLLTFKGTNKPSELQEDRDGRKRTLTETVAFDLTLLLGGTVGEIERPVLFEELNTSASALLSDDRIRFTGGSGALQGF